MMATSDVLAAPSRDAITEQFDQVSCISARDRSRSLDVESRASGRFIEVDGLDDALLIPLGGGALHIGRGLAADLRLDDSSVSRRHAIVVPDGPHARLLDDRSLNGTLVNGEPIEQADLHSGDVITVGRLELRYVEL